MLWFLYAPIQLLCMCLCYLTNWLVALFADANGELKGLFRLWQTWDDTLDNKTDIGRMPQFLRYDWDEHYQAYTVQLNGRMVYRELLIKPFTAMEKVKRYFCRVHWLYRNCAYGFAYYLFGENAFPPFQVDEKEYGYFIHGNEGSIPLRDGWPVIVRYENPWAFKCTAPINKTWRWEIYLGWKIQRRLTIPHRAMLAFRVWIKRR